VSQQLTIPKKSSDRTTKSIKMRVESRKYIFVHTVVLVADVDVVDEFGKQFQHSFGEVSVNRG
jgi:hypothetical protein